MSTKLQTSDRVKPLYYNIWTDFINLAKENDALDLGVGYPNFDPPKSLTNNLIKIVSEPQSLLHQYAKSTGHVNLVNTLAKMFSPLMGKEIDATEEVLVAPGADILAHFALQSFINPGDEVIIIEPYFDVYNPMTILCGGIPVFIKLQPRTDLKEDEEAKSSDWILDPEELKRSFNEKTKAIIINTPHNPTGKVFSREELVMISEYCIKYNALCITDEVYQWLTYDGIEHVRIASLPGMWERTVTIGSGGKAFCVTGWKLGWCIAAADIMRPIQAIAQVIVYSSNKPMQEALAQALENEIINSNTDKSFLFTNPVVLKKKRDRLASLLRSIGLNPIIPQGGFFMVVDISKLDVPVISTSDETRDKSVAKWLIVNKKIATIPMSGFYTANNMHLGNKYLRFCFAKVDSTFDELEEIFKNWTSKG